MQTKNYLQYIVEKIHSAVFATVDGKGRPVTCAIDMMDYDESGLYFLTCFAKILIWKKYIRMCAPAVPSPYSKFTRGRENGLTFPGSRLNAPAFLLAGRRQRKQVTL